MGGKTSKPTWSRGSAEAAFPWWFQGWNWSHSERTTAKFDAEAGIDSRTELTGKREEEQEDVGED